MLRLALIMARHRVAALLAVAFALLGGAAVVTTVGVIADSGFRSHVSVERFGGADVLVSANQTYGSAGDIATVLPERARVPLDVVGRLAQLPDVTLAVGDLSFPAAVVDRDGHAIPAGDAKVGGHGWSSAAMLAGEKGDSPPLDGSAPAGANDVAVGAGIAASAGVRPGDHIVVVVAGVSATYRVSGVLGASTAGIYFEDATAARIAGRDAGGAPVVDVVALRTAPGAAESVAAAAREVVHDQGLVVSAGSARGDAESPAALAGRNALPLIAGSLSGVSLLVVGFIVAGALGVSFSAQRRDFALMRAVGATPRQIRTVAATQATAVALVAMVPGVALGYLLAEQLRALLVTSGLLPATLPLSFGPLPAVATVLLLVGVVQVAARSAASRTSRLPATEAVAESRSEPRAPSRSRALTGVLLIVGSTATAVTPLLSRTQVGAAGTALAGMLAAIGLALLGPLLISRITRILGRRLPARASASSWLAVANSHAYALRAGAAVSTLALLVVFTLTYTFTQTTVLAATTSDLRDGTTAQATLSAPDLGGLPDDALASVRAVPGVEAAAPVGTTTVLWPSSLMGEEEVEPASALILTPDASAVLDLGVRSGSLADLTGATVAVDTESARSKKTSLGATVNLVLGDGARVAARVVAVYTRGLAFGPVVLSRDLAAGHTAVLDQSALIRTDGTPAAAHALAAFAGSQPGLVVDVAGGESASGADAAPAGLGGVPKELWINVAVLGVLLAYLLLGVANKLVASTLQRRNEIATLQLAGATPRQVRMMMRREAALASVVAVVTGVALSAVPLALLGLGFVDRPWPAGPGWLLPVVAVVVCAIAFLAIELPTRQALRTPPALALARPS
ncbi:ABC transporter permease [Cellulomonas sp. KRMCY2]|uniref:ABC transporter permease n=1 Tax=Cellulomonas sp. KRMCY2 TaxID=1304865 RepID=UPI00045EAF58|nr:ABC transporter permease [Cellulomonas sp. KRMCY2]